jgi:hypothetical protein
MRREAACQAAGRASVFLWLLLKKPVDCIENTKEQWSAGVSYPSWGSRLVVSHVELTVMAIVATHADERDGGTEDKRTTMSFRAKCNFAAIARRKTLRPITSFQHE